MNILAFVPVVSAIAASLTVGLAAFGFLEKRSIGYRQRTILEQIEKLEAFIAKELDSSVLPTQRTELVTKSKQELEFWYGKLDKVLKRANALKRGTVEEDALWIWDVLLLHVPRSWIEGIASTTFYIFFGLSIVFLYIMGLDFQGRSFSFGRILVSFGIPNAIIDLSRYILLAYFAHSWSQFERKRTFAVREGRIFWKRLLFQDGPRSRRELLARIVFLFSVFTLISSAILVGQPLGHELHRQIDMYPSDEPMFLQSMPKWAFRLAPFLFYAWAYAEGIPEGDIAQGRSVWRSLRFLYIPKDYLGRLLLLIAAGYLFIAFLDSPDRVLLAIESQAMAATLASQWGLPKEDIAEMSETFNAMLMSFSYFFWFCLYGGVLYAIHRVLLCRHVASASLKEKSRRKNR
jgi:hypothetical protein